MSKIRAEDAVNSDAKDGFDFLEYPVEFQFKAMCRARDGVCMQTLVCALITSHVPEQRIRETKLNDSRTGKYAAVSVSLLLENRDELERIYQELANSEHVVMTL